MYLMPLPFLIGTLAGLFSFALAIGGGYIVWQWTMGQLATASWFAAGIAMLLWSALGRFLVLAFYPRGSDEPHPIHCEPGRTIHGPDGSSLHLEFEGNPDKPVATLGVLRGAWGWAIFGAVWGLAAAGVALTLFGKNPHPIFATGLYLSMGWLVVIAVDPLFAKMPAAGLCWLLAGGLSYTVGVIFFATDSRLPYGHLIWHLFVVAGTTCHYFAALWYAAGPVVH